MGTNGKRSNSDSLHLTQRLNARRRELIRPVLEQPRQFVLLSLRSTAGKIGSDPATLLRTVQAMGFRRYRDFQQYLHERSIAYSTSLDAWLGHKPAAGTPRLVRASIERDMQNLQQLRSGLNAERLIALARRLYKARRIVLLAGDVVSCVAHYLQYNFAMLGLNAIGVYMPGEIVHQVRHLKRQDVVIAITYGRGLRQTVEGLKGARQNGAFCVGISDNYISPLQSFAHQFFVTSTDRVSFADSYVAAMAFCNALLVACADVERRRTVALLKKVAAEQRHGYRWYSERR